MRNGIRLIAVCLTGLMATTPAHAGFWGQIWAGPSFEFDNSELDITIQRARLGYVQGVGSGWTASIAADIAPNVAAAFAEVRTKGLLTGRDRFGLGLQKTSFTALHDTKMGTRFINVSVAERLGYIDETALGIKYSIGVGSRTRIYYQYQDSQKHIVSLSARISKFDIYANDTLPIGDQDQNLINGGVYTSFGKARVGLEIANAGGDMDFGGTLIYRISGRYNLYAHGVFDGGFDNSEYTFGVFRQFNKAVKAGAFFEKVGGDNQARITFAAEF